jgi:UDP-GlcNAc:undecaprenyl-phosphate GlcNAc-1-phosphate transferase
LPGFVSGERKVGNYRARNAGRSRRLPLVGGPALLLGIGAGAIAAGSEATLACLAAAAAFFLSGLLDDLLKAGRGRGLSERASLLTAVFSTAWASGWLLAVEPATGAFALANWIDNSVLLAGWYFLLILAIAIGAGFSDGIDGLAAGLGLIGLGALWIGGAGRAGDTAGLIGSGLAGFLALNLPGGRGRRLAKIYLGDSGALLIGVLVAGAAIVSGYDLLLPLLAAVWILEGASSLIQAKLLVPLFRRSRKLGGPNHRTRPYQQFRLPFIATPLHHHLDICGLGRFRTVLTLFGLQLLFSALALLSIAALSAWQGMLLAVVGCGTAWLAFSSLRSARILLCQESGRRRIVLRHGRWRFLTIERARLEVPDSADVPSEVDGAWLDPVTVADRWEGLSARVER